MSTKVVHLPYADTKRYSELVLDLLQGTGPLREHNPYTADLDGLVAAARTRTFDAGSRSVLCAALDRQYNGIEVGEEVAANLRALRADGTLTVTTGHQLCLFTGPLYVPFKILNVIRLARSASARLDRPVVPVFWMASEDQDSEEIDHTYMNGSKITWQGTSAGAVGAMRLKDIDAAVEAAIQALGSGQDAERIAELLRACYAPDHTLAQATRLFVNALFGRFGLVILDGDDPELKRLFAPVLREELLNQVAERSVRYANDRLEGHYGVQAHAREINLFHLRPGHRSRIVLKADHFQVLDNGPRWSLEEMLAEVDRNPQDFSPNVILRPVYQEVVLPNIAYVGGGGEIAYWMQLRWLFQALQVPMPVVLLRTSAAAIGIKHLRQWEALGLSVADLFEPLEEVRTRVARTRSSFPVDVEAERRDLNVFYDALMERAAKVDVTLKGAVDARRTRALRGLEQVGKALVRAAKRQQEVDLRQLDTVHAALFPSGSLQERRENILPTLATRGVLELDRLMNELDPLHPRFTLFVED
ncbi:MAG: bacillithiol biosynthesis cysteine-adding enzyme BshC [Flavobacteriales bacterium]|nr:bacillithiol biosynthesis cysteine-adding enzyme BshC [Flavobacteriales bacterium]